MTLAPEWQSDALYEGENARFPHETITMVARKWKLHKGVWDRHNIVRAQLIFQMEPSLKVQGKLWQSCDTGQPWGQGQYHGAHHSCTLIRLGKQRTDSAVGRRPLLYAL
eukprot:2891257-Rhodomonas_salina.1